MYEMARPVLSSAKSFVSGNFISNLTTSDSEFASNRVQFF